jgi:hypothetical protein
MEHMFLLQTVFGYLFGIGARICFPKPHATKVDKPGTSVATDILLNTITDVPQQPISDKNYIIQHTRCKWVCVKLLPLPQPPVRARTDARTNPSAQRATQLRSVLARVCAVSIQNQITTTVP